MRVGYAPQDFSGPGFYRCIFPLLELQKHGHYVSTPPYKVVGERAKNPGEMTAFSLDFSRFPECDLALLQMPLDAGVLDFVKALKAHGVVVVGEADDSERLPDWHPAYTTLTAEGNPLRNREWRRRIFQTCDALTVTTPTLAEEWKPYAPRYGIHVLPNQLLGEMWKTVIPQFHIDRERVRIGWMGRSLWRGGDLTVLKPWVHDFLVKHPNVDFVAAGDETIHDVLEVPEQQRISYPPIDFPKGLARITATMDIGLVPLARSTEVERHFNDCKSTLKGMEYAACGIPCVASPSAPYRAWVQPGRTGLLADTPQEWVAATESLLDHTTRKRMGQAAYRLVNEHHTVERNWTLWESLYEDLIERRSKSGSRQMAVPRRAA